MPRRAARMDVEWATPEANDKFQWEHVQLEVLMDIREELRTIRRLAQCGRIPRALDTIVRIDKRLAKRINLKKGTT
jgi:hypothetical protein